MASTTNGTQVIENGKAVDSKEKEAELSLDPLPEDYKEKKLVRKNLGPNPLKYKAWLAGHASMVGFGSISFIFLIFWLPNKFYINSIAYRLALLGSAIALGATVSHKFGFTYLPPTATLVAQQNFQYLILSVVWLFTFKSVFKIIPYFLIAILHLGHQHGIQQVNDQAPFLAQLIAYDELFLVGYLLIRTLFFRNTSGFQLVLFLIFYWLRILYNDETKALFEAIIERLDGKISNVKNPKVQHIWLRTKETVLSKEESGSLN